MRPRWRREQQSIHMVLGASAHHSALQYGAPRGQKIATRAGEGEKATRRSTRPRSRRLLLTRRSSVCLLRKTPSWGRAQGRSRTLCRMARWSGTPWSTGSRSCPFVQILDAPVPQMGEQLGELLQQIVTASLVERVQVTAVPKISLDCIPQRSAVRCTQMVEQLVEVPSEPG